jgi:DNA-binding winged helix-turn-helix (wHTH) protein
MATIDLQGGLTFHPATGEVTRADGTARLEPQPAAVLAELLRCPGELVTHDELRRAVWGDATHVQMPDALHYCVRQIRAALGDSPSRSTYIETIPRRGYRFRAGAVVRGTEPSEPAPATRAPLARPDVARSRVPRLALGVSGLALLALVAFVERRPNNHHEIAVAVVQRLHDLIY